MAVLVIAEHHNGLSKSATRLNKVVTAAAKFGGDVDVLVAGKNAAAAAPKPPRSPVSARCCRRRRDAAQADWPKPWKPSCAADGEL
jgi:electron transfer flavoprotein alpha subunit